MENIYKDLGQRIKGMREQAGMSQQKLAELLRIPRPGVSQIENGERKVATDELVKLSEIFGLSVARLLDFEKQPEVVLPEAKKEKRIKPGMRINVPQKNLEKFKEVLLYILNKVGSKPNIGETVIYKLLYFIDFDFYEKYEEQLVGATYMRNKFGPTPVEFIKIVERMIKNGEIEKVESEYFQFPQTKYLPIKEPDLTKLKAHEQKVMDDVLNRLSDMSAKEISAYSHQDVPWLTTKEGERIEYESVFYRTPPYSVRDYSEDL